MTRYKPDEAIAFHATFNILIANDKTKIIKKLNNLNLATFPMKKAKPYTGLSWLVASIRWGTQLRCYINLKLDCITQCVFNHCLRLVNILLFVMKSHSPKYCDHTCLVTEMHFHCLFVVLWNYNYWAQNRTIKGSFIGACWSI